MVERIVIQEILTMDSPYAYIHHDLGVMRAIMTKQHPKVPPTFETWNTIEKQLWAVCKQCWQFKPELRPTMLDLIAELSRIRLTL